MVELFQAAFAGVNVIYTAILLLVLVYWLIVILGIVDLETLDLNLDVDADVGGVDVDGGLDGADAAAGSAGGFSWFAFFNVGEAPIIFHASIVTLAMWVVSIQVNHWIDVNGPSWANDYQGWIAVAITVPNFLFALFVAKFCMLPIKRLRNADPQRTKLVGKVANVTSLEVNGEMGRVELPKQEGSLILNARTRSGERLQKGDAVEILERVQHGNGEYFVVTRKQWT